MVENRLISDKLRYNNVLSIIEHCGDRVNDTLEIVGASLELPVDELFTSRKRLMSPYYLVGELLLNYANVRDLEAFAYYSSFWKKISDDGKTIRSAYFWQASYGHGFNQIDFVIKQLRENPSSRQAIIHLHHPNMTQTKDEICTLTIQFILRENGLNMIVNMRSNDIILGLPYDHSLFVFLGSFIAKELNTSLVKYIHNAGSLHKYDRHLLTSNITEYKYFMNYSKNFFNELLSLVDFEHDIRNDRSFNLQQSLDYFEEICDPLSEAFLAILLLYKCKKEGLDVEDSFNEIINSTRISECDLIELLKEYEGWC